MCAHWSVNEQIGIEWKILSYGLLYQLSMTLNMTDGDLWLVFYPIQWPRDDSAIMLVGRTIWMLAKEIPSQDR